MLITIIYLDINEENIAEGASRAEGNILYVSETGSTWSSIQEAVDNASAGDTIFVGPGNYTDGLLLIGDSIDIVGNSSQGEVNILFPGNEAVVGISGKWINITGINIVGQGGHIYLLMCSHASNVTFKDLELSMDSGDGIYIRDCFDIMIEGMKITQSERDPIEISDVDRLTIDGFEIEADDVRDCFSFDGGCGDITIKNGTIGMDHEFSVPFRAEDDLDLVIDNVSATYQYEFLHMERGSVVTYDTFFDPEDVNITSGSVNDTVKAYVRKELTFLKEERNGSMTPTEGVEINITSELGAEYRTPYYGGSDDVSSSGGRFIAPMELMFFNQTGGGFPYTSGTASLEAFYPDADMNGTIVVNDIDLSNKYPIVLEFRDLWYTDGTVFGKVTYGVGPLNGSNVSKAVIGLGRDIDLTGLQVISSISEVPSEDLIVWNITTDENGTFHIPNIPFYDNYTLLIIPKDWAMIDGSESGYIIWTQMFAHPPTGYGQSYPDTEIDVSVPYYYHIPPVDGSISGTVRYSGGPHDGGGASNVTVKLYNLTGALFRVVLSDDEGNFTFENISFGEGYELKATPSDDILGINNERTGYLLWDGSSFNHTTDTIYNISLKYYEYISPIEKHPKVAIIDKDNDPILDVKVTVKIGSDTFIAYTNENGIAEFTDFNGTIFPATASFKAELEGYDTIEWDQGEGIPKMGEEKGRSDDMLLIWILIGMIVIILVFGTILIIGRKKPPIEEE